MKSTNNRVVKLKEKLDILSKIENLSASLFPLSKVTTQILDKHTKLYAKLSTDETPLLAINYKILGSLGGYCWSGVVITDKKLYYKVLEDSWFTGIIAHSKQGEVAFEQIRNISIGKHDHCFGTAYVGHQLIINDSVVGLLRMGGAVMFDEDMMEQLGGVFKLITDSYGE